MITGGKNNHFFLLNKRFPSKSRNFFHFWLVSVARFSSKSRDFFHFWLVCRGVIEVLWVIIKAQKKGQDNLVPRPTVIRQIT